MKVLTWLLGIVMTLAVLVFGAQLIASETGEVVVLHTSGTDGEAHTRLWVVDHGGRTWLRSGGGPGASWYARLLEQPRVALTRDGERRAYLARTVPGMGDDINALMAEKYGWRDDFIGLLLGGRDQAVAIELVPDGE